MFDIEVLVDSAPVPPLFDSYTTYEEMPPLPPRTEPQTDRCGLVHCVWRWN